jgi:phosphopentomutase
MNKKRSIILVIDALGIGSLPDWNKYDEVAPSNTLRSVCEYNFSQGKKINLPNLQNLGLANIVDLPGLPAIQNPIASFGKMSELNDAKDTITGHWEMMGIKALNPFPYYPNGFPDEILNEFKSRTGVAEVLGNCTASGTEIINRFGDEHACSGFPIIYTSADSVMQIACDVAVVDLETQYRWCEIAREIMRGNHEVARIIARPFALNPNWSADADQQNLKAADMKYIRLGDKRHDYSVLPHGKSVLETVLESGGRVLGLGKIQDIFACVGVPENIHTKSNIDGLEKIIHALKHPSAKDHEVLFINLVETDSNYGHRRDPEGFLNALEQIDSYIPEILSTLTQNDVLMISADHGCDPCSAGTDHTREYVPILCYSPALKSRNLGTRESFADIGATVLDWFGLDDSLIPIAGKSLIN